jgi:protein TonB
MVFTVGTDGRVTSCTVTRSSGVPELDALTCRLIQQRFRYRPSTDRFGRPIPDEVEGEHDWVAGRG